MATAGAEGSSSRAIYVISVAAELAGVHPQTLRIYERKGLLQPQRTAGNTRRYSDEDIVLLRRIQELTREGINLAGVIRILELEGELGLLQERYAQVVEELEEAATRMEEMAVTRDSMAMVPLRDIRRIRRALKADMLDQASRRRTFIAPPVG